MANKDNIKEIKLKTTLDTKSAEVSANKSAKLINKSYTDEFKNINKSFSSMQENIFENFNKNLNKSLSDAKRSFNEIFKEISKIKSANEKLSKPSILSSLPGRTSSLLTFNLANSIVGQIVELVSVGIELENSFANIQAVTSSTDEVMSKLKDTILEVGKNSKYTVEEISDVTTTLGQAGLSAEEINNVLETTTQLAAGTGSQLSNTVDLMTSALAVWNESSENASHLSDVMVTGMNKSKATLETFRMGVQYAGATLASLNVSFDEFAAVAAAASNAGLKASVVGTGLRAMVSELISPTKKMVNGLSKLGLTTEDVNVETQGLTAVLHKLKNAGLDASNAYSLFGKRAAQFTLAAQGQLDVVDKLRVSFLEQGSTLKAYGTQMETVSSQLTALKNNIKSKIMNVFDSISGPIRKTLSSINNFLNNDAEKSINKITNVIQRLKTEINYLDDAYKLLEKIKTSSQNKNSEEQLENFNSIVKSLNEIYGLDIELASSVDDINSKYEKLLETIIKIKNEKREERDEALSGGKDEIVGGFYTKAMENADKQGNLKLLLGIDPKYRFDENIRNYRNLYIKSEKSIDDFISDEIEKIENNANKEIYKLQDELLAVHTLDQEKVNDEIIERIKFIKEFNIQSLKALTEQLKFETSNLENNDEYKKASDEIERQYNEISTDMIKSFEVNSKKSFSNMSKNTSEEIKKLMDSFETKIKEISIGELTPEQEKLFGEILRTKIGTLQSKLSSRLTDISSNLIDKFIKLFTAQKNFEEVKKLEDIADKDNENYLDAMIKKAKLDNKQDTNSRKTARELERERAAQFNKQFQWLSLRSQSDEYASKSAQAIRSGVQSGLSYSDKTLSGFYGKYSSELSRYEGLTDAISKKQTLTEYEKKYGDLFTKVKEGKITLEDADNKSDRLVSKMMELDLAIQKAEGEFGNLNEIDLDEINKKTKELKNKLKEISEEENPFKKMGLSFKYTIEEMTKDALDMGKIGANLANSFTDGITDAFTSIIDGSKSAKEAFAQMAIDILKDIQRMIIRMLVLKAIEAGISAFGGSSKISETGGVSSSTVIEHHANGGMVLGGIRGRDSVPTMLMPGEYVLKKSAVDALGSNFLNDLNNNAAQTLTNTASNLVGNDQQESSSEPSVVNVWVVSKEDEAQMGPNDVIATISKDIMTGGQTRRLIQSVVAGRK